MQRNPPSFSSTWRQRLTSQIRNDLNGSNYLNVLSGPQSFFIKKFAVIAPVGTGMHRLATAAARPADQEVDIFLRDWLRRAKQTGLIIDYRGIVEFDRLQVCILDVV